MQSLALRELPEGPPSKSARPQKPLEVPAMPADGGHERHQLGGEDLPFALAHFTGNECAQMIDILPEQPFEALQPGPGGFRG